SFGVNINIGKRFKQGRISLEWMVIIIFITVQETGRCLEDKGKSLLSTFVLATLCPDEINGHLSRHLGKGILFYRAAMALLP
ncbi:MAG: hypothetical protein OEV28_08575, partial [Nitrospirota bacterium]|nr:hypothetical protein [Nitrospirota bacterium]